MTGRKFLMTVYVGLISWFGLLYLWPSFEFVRIVVCDRVSKVQTGSAKIFI